MTVIIASEYKTSHAYSVGNHRSRRSIEPRVKDLLDITGHCWILLNITATFAQHPEVLTKQEKRAIVDAVG